MTKDEALKLALEAMEYADACLKKQLTMKYKHEYAQDLLLEAGTAIKEALAQPEQEPVAWRAWVSKFPQGTGSDWVYVTKPIMKDSVHNQPLYTTPPQGIYYIPPQRTWVGLTEKDICEAAVKSQEGISPRDDTLRFAIAIEAKLKEKNT